MIRYQIIDRRGNHHTLDELVAAVLKAEHIYLCGNGGSAANAIHIANDLISCSVRAHALTGDIATLTAIANDYSYEAVFSMQLITMATPRDLLIVLSGSGNSPNILLALEAAREVGCRSWAIVGGGKAAQMADYALFTPSNMQASEEMQLVIGHHVMKKIREAKAK